MNAIKTINGLEITDVIIFPVKHKCKQSNLLAFAKVVFNDQFLVTGIKILEGKNGPFIAFPVEYDRISGKNYDSCFPVTRELREYITDEIISQYNISLHAITTGGV